MYDVWPITGRPREDMVAVDYNFVVGFVVVGVGEGSHASLRVDSHSVVESDKCEKNVCMFAASNSTVLLSQARVGSLMHVAYAAVSGRVTGPLDVELSEFDAVYQKAVARGVSSGR